MEAKSLKPSSPESEESLPENEVSTEENRDKKTKEVGPQIKPQTKWILPSVFSGYMGQ